MSPQTIKAISDALTPLAQKIGQGAGVIFDIYTKKNFAQGIVTTVLCLFFLWLIGFVNYKAWTKNSVDAQIAATILGVVGGVIALLTLGDGLMHILAPQYYAISDLLSQARGQ